MIDYVKVSIVVGLSIVLFGTGYWMGYSRYVEYKKQVEIAGKAQEAKIESIKKQQELATKSAEKEYEAKIAAIRNYYKSTSLWNNPSSGKVSGLSATPNATDVITAYNLLAGQCAETTAQTIALQDWIKTQVGIK